MSVSLFFGGFPDTLAERSDNAAKLALYQNGVELELVSRILGHTSTQTTRIYATPSMEMLNKAMGATIAGIPEEEELWLNDESELARLCGIR